MNTSDLFLTKVYEPQYTELKQKQINTLFMCRCEKQNKPIILLSFYKFNKDTIKIFEQTKLPAFLSVRAKQKKIL